jgi:hypothetical protein
VSWFWKLDPPTRAALIGTCATVASVAIAFLGVLLTIRANRIHARDDQLLNLRREAYLQACDISAEAVQFLTSLPDPNIPIGKGMPVMLRVFGVMGKLGLLADKPTLTVLDAYMNEFLDAYIEVLRFKGPFEINRAEIATANERLSFLATSGPDNPALITQRPKLQAQILRLSRENLEFTDRLTAYCPTIPSRLAPFAAAVTLALRSDLNLPIDQEWYKRKHADNLRVAEQRARSAIEVMQRHLAKIDAERPPW